MTDTNRRLDQSVGTIPLFPSYPTTVYGAPFVSTINGVPLVSTTFSGVPLMPTISGVPYFDSTLTPHGFARTNFVLPESATCPYPSSPPLFGRGCPPGSDQTTIGKACCTPYNIEGAANLGRVGVVGYPGVPFPDVPAEVKWGDRGFLSGGEKYEALKERANKNIKKARKNIEKLKSMCTDLLKLNEDLIKQNKKLKSHIAGGKCGCETE